MTPKVSVIVPVFNHQDFLRQCIDSVLAQSCYEWELLLVDDGSTDSSLSICREAAQSDQRIKVLPIPHSGVSAARNKGIDVARGEFLAFLDADDVLHPSMLSILLQACESQGADISAATISRFRENDSPSSSRKWKRAIMNNYNNSSFIHYSGEEMALRMLYQKGADASACGKLFRRSLFASFRFREDIRYEDLELIPKVAAKAKLAFQSPMPLYYYCENTLSFTHTFSMQRADALKATASLREYFNIPDSPLARAAADRELSASFNILCLMESGKDTLLSPEREEAEIISETCMKKIKELRMQSLLNSKVRIKNKLGITASLLGGKRLLAFLARISGSR